MFDWLSTHRADIAAVFILILIVAFAASIYHGVKFSIARKNDEVFGDPERTKGGWYWAVTGVSTILLLWFYFSWGMARAYFPYAANEMCQIAKIEEALSPIKAQLPIGSRYFKSTTLVVRNGEQIDVLETNLPSDVFTAREQGQLGEIISDTRNLLVILSDPELQSRATSDQLQSITVDVDQLSAQLGQGYDGLAPSAEALNQPRWGVTETEIPLLPMTARGVLFDQVSVQAADVTKRFLKLRNFPEGSKLL